MSKKLLIVESPSKATTIQGYLGEEFEVIASKGHVRQLQSKKGSVQIENGIQFKWDTSDNKMQQIYKKLSGKEEIILATDMDREGEAIAYHLKNLITQYFAKKKEKISIRRISFFEITKNSILSSLKNPRDIDNNLVQAYLTRIALDYSVGYQLTPQLWKNLKSLGRNQSAGRVQSSALKIIAQREKEILNFQKEKSYSLEIKFLPDIEATLIFYKGEKIDHKNKDFLEGIQVPKNWQVKSIKEKIITINTPAPFITSSLQQEASNKLGMKIENVMKVAQSLYEGVNIEKTRKALITYIRTDSTNISKEALTSIFDFIKENYPYLSVSSKTYASKVKNAQEAHECIRAIDVNITPESIKSFLTKEQYDLYNLVWSRTIACQMQDASRKQISIDIESQDFLCRANFSHIENKGFLSFLKYHEKENKLPDIKVKETLLLSSYEVVEHNTKPPARYNEATLIKQCEGYGIGRPSTYVPIINTLIKREYVKISKKSFEISFKGMIVYFFLEKFFSKYVDLLFTSNIEDMLDQIANGQLDFEKKTIEFIQLLEKDTSNMEEKQIREILDGIESLYKTFYNIQCSKCKQQMKMSYNFLLECENCKHIEKIGEKVAKIGKFDFIETEKYKALKVDDRVIYLPQNFKEEMTEEIANFIVTLPKEFFEKEGEKVICGMSKYGFYLKYYGNYYTFDIKDLIHLSIKEINEILDKKILLKSQRPPKDIKGEIIETSYGPCEVIISEQYKLIKSPNKIINLPQNFSESLNRQKIEFIISLPKTLYHRPSDSKPVETGMSKFGFFLKYNGIYYSFTLEEITTLKIEEIDYLLTAKIKTKANPRFKNKLKKGF